MLEAREIVEQGEATLALKLPFDLRRKSRQRAVLDGGQAIALFLPRGSVLRDGVLLRTTDGLLVRVQAAEEHVSTATSDDGHLLMRAAYHLGNRHVALQIGLGFLRYQHDHVLDAMLRNLGLDVKIESAPFEPEAGAYSPGSHGHGYEHRHEHGHCGPVR